jgi:hypothetical protein
MSDQRTLCKCSIPDPVMQADRRFYCYTCSLQVPAVLCERCSGKAVVPSGPLPLLLAMARDWTDPVVVRDSPDRAADVIAQLIGALQTPDPHAGLIAEIEDAASSCEKWLNNSEGLDVAIEMIAAIGPLLRRCQDALQHTDRTNKE